MQAWCLDTDRSSIISSQSGSRPIVRASSPNSLSRSGCPVRWIIRDAIVPPPGCGRGRFGGSSTGAACASAIQSAMILAISPWKWRITSSPSTSTQTGGAQAGSPLSLCQWVASRAMEGAGLLRAGHRHRWFVPEGYLSPHPKHLMVRRSKAGFRLQRLVSPVSIPQM